MKKIAIAFGIIACLVVLSLLLTSASARNDWMNCPSGWGDLYPTKRDLATVPYTVYYMRNITGIGKEDVETTVATHGCFRGITAEASARGTGEISRDRQTIDIDTTKPEDPKLGIISHLDKTYARADFSGSLGVFDNTLRGEISTKNYVVGAAVSEKYCDTYDIAGEYTHEGTGKSSRTLLEDREVFGTTRFAVTVKNPENNHHTVMRSREEHTGLYNISRDVNIVVYP
jgi:hypothetical protein